jgi:predicted negative regulator of RcsB-dependent stress response
MTDNNPTAHKPARADDRNLVDAGATPEGPTLEERLFEFWEKNRSLLLGAVVVVLVAIVGRQVWGHLQERKEAGIRAEFGSAVTSEQKSAFARAHAGHALAGVALLFVADEAYTNREYDKAAQLYAEAGSALSDPVLRARALLGEGMAGLQSGSASTGVAVLTRLADDAAAPESLRFEALYHLASHALASGDAEASRSRLDKLDALNPVGIWASRSAALRARLPVAAEAGSITLPGL